MNKNYFSPGLSKIAAVVFLGTSVYFGFDAYRARHPKPIPPPCPVSYNYTNGESVGIINYETAQALYNNYQKDRGKASISKEGNPDNLNGFIEDANSVWFSLDRLKNFLWHIEKQNCEKPCQDTLGLRIYFGKYPDLKNLTDKSLLGLEDVPKEYSNHHTLFMVPTYRNKDGYDYDFYPGGDGCRTPIDKSPLLERMEKANVGGDPGDVLVKYHAPTPYMVLMDAMGMPSNAQNHGGLIPPNDPTGTSFH